MHRDASHVSAWARGAGRDVRPRRDEELPAEAEGVQPKRDGLGRIRALPLHRAVTALQLAAGVPIVHAQSPLHRLEGRGVEPDHAHAAAPCTRAHFQLHDTADAVQAGYGDALRNRATDPPIIDL